MSKFLAILTVAFALAAPALAAAPATRPAVDHAAYDALLKKHVGDDGLVDYLVWRESADDSDALAAYLDEIAGIDPSRLERDERLALYLNLYNATMIRATLDRYRVGWDPKAGTPGENQPPYAIFKAPLVRTNGRTISLDDLEHTLVRAGFREPRIHAALVCAATDCPPLRPVAFTAANLEEKLEGNMRAWVNDPARNDFAEDGKTLAFSGLFRVYADDFGGVDALPSYLARYSDRDLSEAEIGYKTTYDWAPNIAPPAEGEWVQITLASALHDAPGGTATDAVAEAGQVLAVLDRGAGWVLVQMPRGGATGWVRDGETKPFEVPSSTEKQ